MVERLSQKTGSNTSPLEDFYFNQPVVNIGSHADNDIHLTGSGVMPFHAMIFIQEDSAQLVPLAPEADILVNGIAMKGSAVDLQSEQLVDIGEFCLTIEYVSQPSSVHVLAHQKGVAVPPQALTGDHGEDAILVNVLSQTNDIAVEQYATYELEVINGGPIVASFHLVVQGVPEDWVQMSTRVVNLNEGERANISFTITPPRDPSSTAGTHPISLVITSPNYSGHRSITSLEIIIQPYYEFILGNITPKQQRMPWRKKKGAAILPITNNGNSTAEFDILAMDDENGCTFEFQMNEELLLNRQAKVKIPAGSSVEVPIVITPIKNPIIALKGKQFYYTTTVQVAEQALSPQIMSGSLTRVPFFGWWSILLTVLMTVVGLFFLLQPRIRSFEVAAGKDVIELGDTTALEWKVSPFATNLSITNIEQPLVRGQRRLSITPPKSTTYELIASNWLSNLMGMDRRASVTVLTVPPNPDIRVFDVDTNVVDKGKTINLRWSITQAETAFLTIDEVVYELKPEEFSGEREVLLEKDAIITLEAKNASGSELRSTFVNVVPPFIDVSKFIIWVRPVGGVAALPDTTPMAYQRGSGGTPQAALVEPADADFPDRFVELVPDETSEIGYRVEFHQPKRELAKGEQVMLEWDVVGVETVNIAPFTETLPNNGKQPFFPQESMNFVLTAVSGDLEKLFMLPVNVFDGEPPEPPTIEIFEASPSSLVGSGDVEFTWSVSGAWTHIQLAQGEEIIADWINPQGFHTTTVSETANYILTAWNGDLSAAKIKEIKVDPALIVPTLAIKDIYPNSGYFRVGDEVNVFIEFQELDEDDPEPTGEVIISDGFNICTVELPKTVCTFEFTTPGVKEMKGSYGGDDIYASADSEVYEKESIVVEANEVSLSPQYFNLNEDGSQGTNIRTIVQPGLKVGDGIYIDVIVIPENATMEEDKKSQVSARYCPLEDDGEIVDTECITTGGATVEENQDGYFHGVIIFEHLRGAGKYAILISYTHLDGSFEPELLGGTVDDRIETNIEKGELYLIAQSTGSSGTDCTYLECLMEEDDSANVVFDAYLMLDDVNDSNMDNDIYVDLYPNFPDPGKLNMVVEPVPSLPVNPLTPWTENCSWQYSGAITQLYCENVVLESEINLTPSFPQAGDANYTVYPRASTMKMNLKVKKRSEVKVETSVFQDMYVGTTIDIYGDVSVVDILDTPIAGAPVYISLDSEDTSISDAVMLIDGGDPSTLSCEWDNERIKLITDGMLPCKMAFKHFGVYPLKFDYEGDDEFDSSEYSTSQSVQKMTDLVLTWAPGLTDHEIFTDITQGLTITCPTAGGTAASMCDNFAKEVLPGATIGFDLSDDCSVRQGSQDYTNKSFELPALTAGEMIITGLNFRCTTLGIDKSAWINFDGGSEPDFDFKTGDSKLFDIIPRNEEMNARLLIDDSSAIPANYPTVGYGGKDSGDPVENVTELYVGEKYWISVKLESMPEDADPISADEKFQIQLPGKLVEVMSTGDFKKNCKIYENDLTGNFELTIIVEEDGVTWKGECAFIPDTTIAILSADDEIKFDFISDRFDADQKKFEITGDVVKTATSLTAIITSDSLIQPAGPENWYALSDPIVTVTLNDDAQSPRTEHFQADPDMSKLTISTNPDSGTGQVLTTGCSTSGNKKTCPIPDDATWTGSLDIDFTGDDHFVASSSDPDITIASIPVNMTSMVNDDAANKEFDDLFPFNVRCLYCVGTYDGTGEDYAFYDKEFQLNFDFSSLTTDTINGAYVYLEFESLQSGLVLVSEEGSIEDLGTRHKALKIPVNNDAATVKFKFTSPSFADYIDWTISLDHPDGLFTSVGGTGWFADREIVLWKELTFGIADTIYG
ncbi:MAG: FHA domain-containing protein, partial [Anaerolineaceae bacterium]|nr:FHA domain-containing protein [Anaerolineaceae bacterium]